MLGTDILPKAKAHIGEKYVFGADVPLDNSNWKGPWDCAEYVSWLVYQSYGVVFGCGTNDLATAEPYTGFWAEEAKRRGVLVSPEAAASIPGAFLIRKPRSNPSRIGHIGIAIGDGTVYEAAGADLGVRVGPIAGRRWDIGMLLPDIIYADSPADSPTMPPSSVLIFRRQDPPIFDENVVDVQEALRKQGLDPGQIDGLFGAVTEKAVSSFQAMTGLIVDGEVGPATGRALKLTFWGPAPVNDGAITPPPLPLPPLPSDAFGAIVSTSKSYADIKGEYAQLFATCVVQDKNNEIASIANRIAASRERYAKLVATYAGKPARNMPWYFVALVHAMEASGDIGRFRTHLCNGDPLERPTVHVPKDRPSPTGANFTWEESALDALALEGLDEQTDWSLPRMLYNFESFNGFGPRKKGHATAYLWSYSNHYIKGKYIADHVWSDDKVSKQPGVASILKKLVDDDVVTLP